MQKRQSPPASASDRNHAAATIGPKRSHDLNVKTLRQALLGARTSLEREFRELFEAGAELPRGARVQVEAVLDRIGDYLQRLDRGDDHAVTELGLMSRPDQDLGEALLASLLIDAEVDAEFRGPGAMQHAVKPRRTRAHQKLAATRRVATEALRQSTPRADVLACERVLQLAIHLGGEWLTKMKQRYQAEPLRLRREIERRMRSGQNPMRLLGDRLNQIVRASAVCLKSDDDC